MRVDLYDSRDNCINTIENVEKVVALKDGRHLITSIKKCECCGHEDEYTTQVPARYEITIKKSV